MRTRLKCLVDGSFHDMDHVFFGSKDSIDDMRIMLFPKDRVLFVRKFYYPVSRMYAPKFSQDVVDMAFEAFILGFVDKLELVSLMRDMAKEICDEASQLPF